MIEKVLKRLYSRNQFHKLSFLGSQNAVIMLRLTAKTQELFAFFLLNILIVNSLKDIFLLQGLVMVRFFDYNNYVVKTPYGQNWKYLPYNFWGVSKPRNCFEALSPKQSTTGNKSEIIFQPETC